MVGRDDFMTKMAFFPPVKQCFCFSFLRLFSSTTLPKTWLFGYKIDVVVSEKSLKSRGGKDESEETGSAGSPDPLHHQKRTRRVRGQHSACSEFVSSRV